MRSVSEGVEREEVRVRKEQGRVQGDFSTARSSEAVDRHSDTVTEPNFR